MRSILLAHDRRKCRMILLLRSLLMYSNAMFQLTKMIDYEFVVKKFYGVFELLVMTDESIGSP